jgi:peptidoglycan/LPS O-acetylase OafA/YrhL
MNGYTKPGWWKRSARSYWLLFVLIPFVVILLVLGGLVYVGVTEFTKLLIYAVITGVAIFAAYYIRTIPSSSLWRKIWIFIGVGVIGFPLAVAISFLSSTLLSPITGDLPAFVMTTLLAIILGGYLGDRIGKMRDYRPFG